MSGAHAELAGAPTSLSGVPGSDGTPEGLPLWAQRAATRTPGVRRTPERTLVQARAIVEAGDQLVSERGSEFTIQELVIRAGVALQTFYKVFGSKDELLLAVLEDRIRAFCTLYAQQGAQRGDARARLRSYVVAVGELSEDHLSGAKFITAEHWRLAQSYPAEVAAATAPFAQLIEAALRDGMEDGTLHSSAPEADAWLLNQLVMAFFHDQSFALGVVAPKASIDQLWAFCLAAVGGAPD